MTRRPPVPHLPAEDPDAPGACRCGLTLDANNARHTLPPTPPGATALEARRLGEREEQHDA